MSSRNAPNYFAEGRVIAGPHRIDWIAVERPDEVDASADIAVIDSRIFELSKGRVVIVAPQEDQTLRFLHLDAGPMPIHFGDRFDEFKTQVQALVKSDDVRAMIDAEGAVKKANVGPCAYVFVFAICARMKSPASDAGLSGVRGGWPSRRPGRYRHRERGLPCGRT